MAENSVSLPSDLQHYVDARAAADGLHDPAAYLRLLAERDRDAYRADIARVQALIDEGIASGIVDREPEEIIDDLVAGLRRPNG